MTSSPLFSALTTNQPLRLLTVTAMYFAQGIQTGLLLTAIPAYLASQEVAPVAIGGSICWETVAATQFTLYMSLSNLGISLGAILFSGIKPWASYPQLFLFL